MAETQPLQTPAQAGVFCVPRGAALRPASAVPVRTMLWGLTGLAVAAAYVRTAGLTGMWAVWATTLGTAVPMWLAEARRLGETASVANLLGVHWAARAMATLPWLACTALFAWTYPPFDLSAWGSVLAVLLPLWLARAAQDDDLVALDRWLRRSQGGLPWSPLRNITVKAFFLPLMLTFLAQWWDRLGQPDLAQPLAWFYLPLAVMYLVDVAFGAAGYLPAPRATGAGIRSANPYWDAWLAALACYPPFWLWLASRVRYEDGLDWTYHLPTGPAQYAWGAAILALTFVYVWATVVFGPRFSNLTYRGCISAGPYRWLRHPAYVSKNLSWWMMALPFIPASGWREAVYATLCLAGINALYWARAVTEERHLLAYADYRRYYRHVQRHGLLRSMRKSLWRAPRGCLSWWLRRYPLSVPVALLTVAVVFFYVPAK